MISCLNLSGGLVDPSLPLPACNFVQKDCVLGEKIKCVFLKTLNVVAGADGLKRVMSTVST